ncbi:MAG TPA: PKD domain-containing protein [Acidimicrobiales bacterium]|nr:PKD domain-containing protein [Acidimicrobiales bacterium]
MTISVSRNAIAHRFSSLALVLALLGLPAIGIYLSRPASAAGQSTWTAFAAASGSSNVTPIDGAGSNSPSLGTSFASSQANRYVESSPDGSTLYADSSQSTIQVLTASTGALLKTITGDGMVTPMGMAVTPNGSELWVGNDGTNNVMVFCVASGGCGATAQYGLITTVAVGNTPLDVSITPDGSSAYVINFGGSTGQVQVISTSTFSITSTLSTPVAPHYTTFTPDGKFALIASCGSQACNSPGSITVVQNPESSSPAVVDTISTGQNGTHSVEILPNCTPSSCTAYVDNYGSGTMSILTNVESTSPALSQTTISGSGMTNPRFMIATPDSKFIFTGDATSNDIYQISTSSNSIVNTLSSPSVHSRGYRSAPASNRSSKFRPRAAGATGVQGFTITPDQAPVATFTVIVGAPGSATSFDASASTVAYGSIASYVWNFGDGSAPVTTTSPTTNHTYSTSGTFTASVTETSSGGTSTSSVFTGHQTLAHGSANATSTQQVSISSTTTTTSASTTTTSTPPNSTELYISQEHLNCTPQNASIVDYNGGTTSDIESGLPLVQPRGLNFAPNGSSTGNLMIADASDGEGLFTMNGSKGTPTKVAYGPPYSPRDEITDSNGNYIVVDWPTINGVPVESQFGFKPTGGATTPVVSGATAAAVLKITPAGQVSTVFSGLPLIAPHGITMDSQGNYIVADVGAGLIKITPSGQASVIAAAGSNGIISTQDVAIDSSGNYIAADGNGGNLWKVTPAGAVSAVHQGAPFTKLAFGSGNQNVGPRGVVVMNDGSYDVIDQGADALFNITPSGAVTTLSQGGLLCDPADLVVVHDGTTPTGGGGAAGYWMLDSSGNVYPFGSAGDFGSATGSGTAAAIVSTPDGGGYWVASSLGVVNSFGDAGNFTLSGQATSSVVAIATTADGKGYWIATSGGQILTAGDASNFGSPAASQLHLNGGIVAMAVTADGQGYWLLGGDGGVFSYGDASFMGSSGQINPASAVGGANSFTPVKPINGIVATSDSKGYWMVASEGGIFAFGDASFLGSSGQINPSQQAGGSNSFTPAKPIVGMVATSDAKGYWMVGSDGGVFAFGDAGFVGSLGSHPPASPIVGFTPHP